MANQVRAVLAKGQTIDTDKLRGCIMDDAGDAYNLVSREWANPDSTEWQRVAACREYIMHVDNKHKLDKLVQALSKMETLYRGPGLVVRVARPASSV